MKKLLAILILLAAGAFVMAQDTAQTEETPDEDVEFAIQNLGRVPSGDSTEKIKDDKKQLTASQKARIIKKELSKQRKLQRKRQKHEALIEISQRHLDYKTKQLEEFSGQKDSENSEEIKKEGNKEVTENKTEISDDKKVVKEKKKKEKKNKKEK